MEQKSKNTFYFYLKHENFIPHKTWLRYSVVGGSPWIQVVAVISAIVYGYITLVLMSVGFTHLSDYWQFDINGLETSATIIACENDVHSRRPEITYIYTIENVVYNAQDEYTYCGQFPLGTRVYIQYYSNNPSYSRVSHARYPDIDGSRMGINSSRENVIVLTFGIPFCLIGVVYGIIVVIFVFRVQYMYFLLRREGVLLDGEVINATYGEGGGRYIRNWMYGFIITAEFETPDGRLLTRKFSHAGVRYVVSRTAPQPGTPVKILYANDHAVIML